MCTCLAYTKKLFSYVGSENYNEFPDHFSTILPDSYKATYIQPNEETQLFFDKMVDQVLCSGNDGIVIASFKDDFEFQQYRSVFHFLLIFYSVFTAFIDKPNLKFDKLFDELDKRFDITPIFCAGKNPVGGGNGEENDNDNFVKKLSQSGQIF